MSIALFATALAFAPAAQSRPHANRAPSISGTPASSVVAGENYSFTPAASDREGKTLKFTIMNRPLWASFKPSTGRLSGTPSTSAVGEYVEIRISVTDGQKQSSLAPFSVMVTRANQVPTISGSPPTAAGEGQAYEFAPTAADADGDALAFSIVNRPPWASFNSATGALSGTPGSGSVGNYPGISIRVTDGTATRALPRFAIAVQQASLGSVTLSWQPPVTRTDGSPIGNLSGYRIKYGTSAGSYPNVMVIQNAGVTTAVVANLPPATYFFVISAYDAAGLESSTSPPVSKTIS
jgi:hypothetical protein